MPNRLTKIYTRTGDDGSTGMADGSRVAKDDLCVQVIGEIDALNSQLAVLVSHSPDMFHGSILLIQNELFNVGAELSMSQEMITPSNVEKLERMLDELNGKLTPLKEFILPGGGVAASHCHVARAVCRRAERLLVSLDKKDTVNRNLMAYINRLSDFLFVLARAISKEAGEDEVYWQSDKLNNGL